MSRQPAPNIQARTISRGRESATSAYVAVKPITSRRRRNYPGTALEPAWNPGISRQPAPNIQARPISRDRESTTSAYVAVEPINSSRRGNFPGTALEPAWNYPGAHYSPGQLAWIQSRSTTLPSTRLKTPPGVFTDYTEARENEFTVTK